MTETLQNSREHSLTSRLSGLGLLIMSHNSFVTIVTGNTCFPDKTVRLETVSMDDTKTCEAKLISRMQKCST